jgi:alkanesulfonate monooxygenase SsuD/methylene tetrahydromethanopterin reductase-like flavin-dependent oxidoreductase (luciferase family)
MTTIGVLLPTREAVIYGDRSGDPRPLVELAVQVEDAGFDAVWAGDSLLARPRAEPLTFLAAVAARTERVLLGTAVLLPSLRNPEQLAQATATLDAVSGGRFVLGIGAGPGTPGVRADHELVGADFDRRASRSIDVVHRVRRLWRGEDDQMYPLPVSPGGPPIWIGGSGPRTLERTGAHGDGWFPTATDAEGFAAGLATVRAAAEAAGHDPARLTAAAYLTVAIGSRDRAERELAEHSELYYGVPHEVISRQQGSMAGPPDEVGAWLRSFVDAGADHLCVRIGSERVDEQVETLAGLLDELRR